MHMSRRTAIYHKPKLGGCEDEPIDGPIGIPISELPPPPPPPLPPRPIDIHQEPLIPCFDVAQSRPVPPTTLVNNLKVLYLLATSGSALSKSKLRTIVHQLLFKSQIRSTRLRSLQALKILTKTRIRSIRPNHLTRVIQLRQLVTSSKKSTRKMPLSASF